MIKILIADDHAMFREGLRNLLETESDMTIVGEAGTGRETLELCRDLDPDLLLLDLDMPDFDGMDVTRMIAEEGINTKIVALTMHTNEEFAVRLLQAGAAGFIPKYTSSRALPTVIRSVMAGRTYIPDEMKVEVTRRLLDSSHTTIDKLSDRELQVFRAIAEGESIKEIADRLGISPRTVETHKSRIMVKMGLGNIADLVKTSIRLGITKNY